MPTTVHPGDVVLVRFPFTDLTAAKLRPAIVLAAHGSDLVIVGIFSGLSQLLQPTWIRVTTQDPAFLQMGLKAPSIIKAERVAVIEQSIVVRRLGSLPAPLMEKLKRTVRVALNLDQGAAASRHVGGLSVRALEKLQAKIIRCQMCPRLVAWREEVARRKVRRYQDEAYWGKPIPGFGDPEARLLLVGLAPAAHGGNRTGRIFTGDRSGDWLYGALHAFGFANQPTSVHRDDGLALKDAYVTAAVRCAPPANKPTREEMESCRPYLARELGLLRRVRVVVALGKIAFDAYLQACRDGDLAVPRPVPRFGHGKAYALPHGVTLIASYHPSQQNTQTGRLTRAMFQAIFRRARRLLQD